MTNKERLVVTLTDTIAYTQIIGCLMKDPLLLISYKDIYPYDFIEHKVALFV